MAHDFSTGYFVREAAWHGHGLVVSHHPENWAEARRLADIEWEPEEVPIYYMRDIGTMSDDGSFTPPTYEPVEGSKLIVRSDTRAELGTVGSGLQLLTHAEMGELCEAIIGQGGAKYDAVVSLKGGRYTAVTVLLDEPVEIAGDSSRTLQYLVVLNSHDGTGACKVLFLSFRVVCANTFHEADIAGERLQTQFIFRHTSGMKARIDQAVEAMKQARHVGSVWKQTAEELAMIPADGKFRQEFVDRFMPLPEIGSVSDRVMLNAQEAQAKFYELLTEPTNINEMTTGLGLVNAAGEYLDHVVRYRTPESYVKRTLLKPQPHKARAIRIVHDLHQHRAKEFFPVTV